MKKVKSLRGFIIKATSERERLEGQTYNYYLFKGGELIWECDSLEEAKEFIDCY